MTLEQIRAQYRDIVALDAAISLLGWDKQVLMPSGGAAARNAHLELLTLRRHQILTADKFRQGIESEISNLEPGSLQHRELEVLLRDVHQESALPLELVRRKSRVTSAAYETWKVARATSNFALLAPYLEQIVEIVRETSRALGDGTYTPLLDMFEEGATQTDAELMFAAMLPRLKKLVASVREVELIDDTPLVHDWDKEALRSMLQSFASQIGFDFGRGNLSVAPNAFCTHLGRQDVRMTTRASEHMKGILSSSLHEMGHGLYEQNASPLYDGTPLSGGISLAVHESQSRLWENIVGRSLAFWEYFFPQLAERFPSLAHLGPEGMYRCVNKVDPSFIRVGADELTYNLHILIRFELEVAMISGKLAIRDLPEAWNTKYTDYLGITPPNDGLGCLQDVHWSRGAMGYFPTYAMGNVIGGAMWAKVRGEQPELDLEMASGNFEPLLTWLTRKVYEKCRTVRPRPLVESISGTYLDPAPWLDYAESKYRTLYDL